MKPPSNARELHLETQVFYAPAPASDLIDERTLLCACCKAVLQVGTQQQRMFKCHTNSRGAYALCLTCDKKRG